MTDRFAALGLPRRPWIDPEEVREKFHRLAANHHPDVAGGDESRFSEINAAHAALRDPRSRLLHLLELQGVETGGGQSQIPPELAELFMTTGAVRARADAYFRKEGATSSPIAKAALSGERLALLDAVESQIATLNAQQDALLAEVRKIDADWPDNAETSSPRLAAIAHALAFFGKWLTQLRETYARLA